MCLEKIKTWTEIFANVFAVVGIIFGIVGGRLALRQWQLQRYDKFYSIYRRNIDFINAVLGMRLSNQLLSEYALNVLDQGFLFKPKTRAFFNEIYSQANDLLTRESVLKDENLDVASRANHHLKRAQVLEWFLLQIPRTKELFQQYLKVEL
ncbi:MAG TPA: hypothetical protein VGI63_04610 [Verrucomicrobiae bacterium]